jgi:hypothetical protein
VEKEIFGLLAQFIIAIAIIPYIVSIFRGTVKPNRISWFIWSMVGFTFWLVTPQSADEITKMLTVVFMASPTTVFVATLFTGENKKPDYLEIFSLIIGVAAISVWYLAKDSAGVTPTIIAIIADLCALLPTLRFVYASPEEETPFAWIAFFLGSSIALLGIEHYNLENLLLPSYMAFGSFLVVYPLVNYRIKTRTKLKRWII